MKLAALIATVLVGIAPATAQAGCKDHAASGVDWSGCSKKLLMLGSASLDGAKLDGSNLTSTDLGGASLDGANLDSAGPELHLIERGISQERVHGKDRRQPHRAFRGPT